MRDWVLWGVAGVAVAAFGVVLWAAAHDDSRERCERAGGRLVRELAGVMHFIIADVHVPTAVYRLKCAQP